MTLPENMIDRWSRRHDPAPGERTLYWLVLMAEHPEVADLARQAAGKLASFTGLHFTPADKLHMTTLVVGPARDVTERQIQEMGQIATECLDGTQPISVRVGKVLYHPEAIMFAVTPAAALAPIRAAAVAATRRVGVTATDRLDWTPHVTICYGTADQPAAPIVDALGQRLPAREITVSSLSLVIQDGPEREWNWSTAAVARFGRAARATPD